MKIRRIATAAATFIVAIVCALAVPFSQLRTVSVVQECCCPDPAHCHCPDHQPDNANHGGSGSMRACHKTLHEIVSPDAPSFASPAVAIAVPPARIAPRATWNLPEPHAAPAPARPDAPS